MSIRELAERRAKGLGPRVGPDTTMVESGGVEFVPVAPAELARRAGVDVELYSLARLIVSEGYGRSADYLGSSAAAVAIAGVAKFRASQKGQSITEMLTRSNVEEARGYYGRQSKRWAATGSDPRAWHVEVASRVLAGSVANLSGNALKFFDPSTSNGGIQAGKSIKPAAAVLESWSAEGYAWIGPIPAIDSYELMLLRRERDAGARERALVAALEVNQKGLDGTNTPAPGNPDDVGTAKGNVLAMVMGIGAKLGLIPV